MAPYQFVPTFDRVAEVDAADIVHLLPKFGKVHEMSSECWCHPDPSLTCDDVFVHNVMH